jgi:hypothetical protein
MGNVFSTQVSVNDIVAESIMQASSSYAQSCSNSMDINQEMKNVNCNGTIMQVINSDVGQKCLNISSVSANFKNNISESIQKKIKENLDGQNVGFDISMKQEVTKKVERVVSTINFSEVSSCFNRLVYNQSMIDVNCSDSKDASGNAARGITQAVNVKILQDCMLKNSSSVAAINDLQTLYNSIQERSQTGSINTTSIMLIAIVAVIGLIIFLMIK